MKYNFSLNMNYILLLLIVLTVQMSNAGNSYLYDYSSDVSVFSDERIASHKLVLSLESSVTVTPVWSADTNQAEKLLQFQFENFHLKSSSNSSSKVIQHSEELSDTFVTKPFFARFVYGKLQDLFVTDEKEANPALANIQRGVVSLFQFQSGNWEGQESDILGSCRTTYTNDQHGLHKKKSQCQKDKKSDDSKQLFGVKDSWRYDGVYHLQDEGSQEGEEIISKAVVNEVLKQEINLHPNIPRWTKVKQVLHLKGQSNSENVVQGSTVKEAVEKIETKEKISLKKVDIVAQKIDVKSQDVKIKNLVPKLKRQLKSVSLATVSGAKAFLQTRSAVLTSTKEDLVALLKDKRNQDLLHQLMDVFGSSGSLVAHSAAVETFVNPTSTNRPDLCERYLWALAQTKVPETQIVQDIFSFAKDKIANLKLKESIILTLGTLSKKTSDLRLSASIIKWLVQSMVDSCKDDSCIQTFLRSIENSQNVNSAPILLQLVESTKDKKTSFAAMKSFAQLLASDASLVKEKIGFLESRLLSIFMNVKVDTSVRGMVAELLLQMKPDVQTLKSIFSVLRSEKKGFTSFVLSRLSEFSENDPELEKLTRTCINEGYLDWNMLAHGGLSTSFGRQVASAGKAGNSSFSFAMEISGVVLKRSNFQLFFKDKEGRKTDLVQLGVFAGGMSSFIDDGSSKDNKEDSNEEATAGIEIKFLGNALRPFVFFNSMGELMSLYWSGAAEEKNSALQGSVMLQNDGTVTILSNGLSAISSTEGVVSYDFSGQAKVSMWSKQSETLIDNSVAYVLQNKLNIVVGANQASVNYDQQIETETILKVENNLDFGSSGVKVCIRVSQPELHIEHVTSKTIKGGNNGSPQRTESSKKTKIPGKTLFLNRKNCQLCNKMYPKK